MLKIELQKKNYLITKILYFGDTSSKTENN